MKFKYTLILAFLLIALFGSVMTLTEKNSAFCNTENSLSGCAIVQETDYSKTAGINNSYFGIVGFSILSLFTIQYIRKPAKLTKLILFTGISAASFIALYFLYLQAFVIKTFCNYCLVVDFATLSAFAILILMKGKSKTNKQVIIN
jgi:uncharacterized membrane protein